MDTIRTKSLVLVIVFWIALSFWVKGGTTNIWKNPPQQIAISSNLSFIYQQDDSSAITVIQVLVRGGRAAVPVSKRGLAFLATRLAMDLSSSDQFRDIMQMGSLVYPGIEGDYSIMTIKCLSSRLEETLKIVLNVFKDPLFTGPRINNLKGYMEHRNKTEEDAPEELMEQAYLNVFLGSGEYNYGGSDYGDEETRKAISKNDISDFYKKYFNTANVIISVSTDLSEAAITPIMKKYFSSISGGSPVVSPSVSVSVPAQKVVTVKKENQQVHIALGITTPPISRENYVRLYMLDNALGKGIGSKIWSLRTEDGLAYSINTRAMPLKNAGLLMVYLKTDVNEKEQALRALRSLLADFQREGISEDELAHIRTRSKADFLRMCETKEQKARQMAYFEVMGLSFQFLEEFFSVIDRVTATELNEFLRLLPAPEQWVTVIIGPESTQ